MLTQFITVLKVNFGIKIEKYEHICFKNYIKLKYMMYVKKMIHLCKMIIHFFPINLLLGRYQLNCPLQQ